MHKLLVGILLFAVLLSACNPPVPQPSPVAPSATAESPSPVVPTVSGPDATLPAATPEPTLAGPLTEPAVLARYPLGGELQGEAIAAGSGKVWVGTNSGTVLEFDAGNGAPLRTYTLVEASRDNPAPVHALAYDGAHVWALVRSVRDGMQYSTLAVLDPASGATLQQFDVSASDPEHLGTAPGQIWLQNALYDTTTYQSSPLEMATDSSVFAYDGTGMWVGGAATTCDSCNQMLYRYAGGTLEAGPAASQQILGLAAAGEHLWVLTNLNQLDGYTLGAGLGLDSEPDARIELAADHDIPPAQILSDGTRLWLLGAAGKASGRIYQHDPQSGKKIDGLVVGDSSEAPLNASIPLAMAYDGKDLWVLTALHLVRVGLP